MLDLRTLIRPLLAAPFIVRGIQALRAPTPMSPPAAGNAGRPAVDPELLVKANAAAQLGGGAMLIVGFVPRLASLVLSATVISETLVKHRFWEERDAGRRKEQLLEVAKDAGTLGGLLAAALDTGGRPSVFWSGRRAAGRAAHSVADSVSSAYHTLPGA